METFQIVAQITMMVVSVLLSIIGFLIVRSYAEIKTSIAKLTQDMLDTKLAICKLESSMMTETRVRELIRLEHADHEK